MKNELLKFAKKTGEEIAKHSPTILTGCVVAGLITTVVMAVKATPKAMEILEDDEKRKEEQEDERTVFETVKLTWKCYAPATLMGGVTIACAIGANSINSRRIGVLASLYSISESSLKEYQQAAVKTIGENKEQKIRDEVTKKRIETVPCSKNPVIISGGGESLCFDAFSGRYFRNNLENIRRAENDLNQTLFSEMFVSLNEFYREIGLPTIPMGEECGWNVDSLIELSFDSQITDDGQPCIVLDYHVGPRFDYRTLL